MKKKVIFLCLIFSQYLFTQKLRIDYELIRKVSVTLDSNSYSDSLKKQIIDSEKESEKYVLFYSDGNSFFKSLPKKKLIVENEPKMLNGNNTVFIETYEISPTKFFKEINKNELYQFLNVNGEVYYKIIENKQREVDYKTDSKKIDNFFCRLAEFYSKNGDKITVWYTEDIPISIGPFSYVDFPGLVLQVETPHFNIYATKISKDFDVSEIEKIDKKIPIK